MELQGDEIDDDYAMKAIHVLGMSLFCKEHPHIEKSDFIYSVYRFLVMTSIKEDNFMGETNITANIAKLQVMIYEEMMRRMKTMSKKQA